MPSTEKNDRDYPPSLLSEPNRLGAATSLGGIAQYGTERTRRIESASDDDERGVSPSGQSAFGVCQTTGQPGIASPSDLRSGVGGDAVEENETPVEGSDGSDHEPWPASAGRLTSDARSSGN